MVQLGLNKQIPLTCQFAFAFLKSLEEITKQKTTNVTVMLFANAKMIAMYSNRISFTLFR
jgi:hypothetical protein